MAFPALPKTNQLYEQQAEQEGCHMSQYMKALWNCFLRLTRGCEQTPVVGDMKLHTHTKHVFQKKLLINSLLDTSLILETEHKKSYLKGLVNSKKKKKLASKGECEILTLIL